MAYSSAHFFLLFCGYFCSSSFHFLRAAELFEVFISCIGKVGVDQKLIPAVSFKSDEDNGLYGSRAMILTVF